MSSYSLSVLEKWLFRCWCNAIFVLLLVIIMALNSYGQIVTEGATVKVNFGIDADIYANDLTVFESPFTYDTDDWFINLDSFPGDGLGVIDQTTAASLLTAVQANYNTSFELRMSSTPSRNWIDPSTGLLWIDAVYFRDWNSQGNFNDESVFTSGQDKNGADPSTWSLGTGGTPQKNDLVDVMGHMRQDINGDVYGIGAFTTISSDGNSHADFEFFQNQIDFVGGALTNLGPDAGHTAWEFDADNVTQVGDLIVSIDFENGGTNPQASVRLWMSDATFATLSGAIPSNVDFTLTGEFDSGEGADGYGYAEIEATGAFAVAWAIVNVNEAVLGAPWGSLEAKTWYENIQELQYAEFAINLTAIGIGDFGGADPCNKTLGSLMVKTRSSSSFTAELKDFAGPFLFGIELTTDVAVHDSEECQDEVSYNIDLTANVDTTFGNIITYHNSYDDATQYIGVITDSTSHNIPLNEIPKTIYVRASNPQDIECFVVDSFTIGFYPNPVCDITSYDASNIYTYDGAAKVNTPDIVSYNWYTTDGLISGGTTTDSIWGLKGSLDGIDYYVDLEDSNGCTVTCTTTVYAGTYTPPDCTVEVVDATCDGYNNGSAKLQDVPPNWADYDYAWYKLPDEITVIGTDTMITSLDSGTYKLVITDNNLDVPQSTECDGTVSDRDPVTLTCPGDYLEITCTDPVDIKTHFDNWLAGVSVIGSDSMLTTDWDSVTYPNACGDTITVTLTLHDECAIPNTCSATFRVPADLTDPVLANLPTGGDLGCNPTAPSCDDNVTASDNCDGDISADVVCTPMAITGDDCNKAQTFMYTVEDECGNADTAYVNYTWKVDLTDPVLANLPTGGDLGCNPTAPSCDDSVTASDNCDGDISADVVCTPMAITGDDCNKAQTFMYTVEDECGNADTAYVNYTWKVDLTEPVLANLPTGGDLGCNPTAPSCDDSVTASDNCDGDISADVVCTPMAITGDDCNKAQTVMYTVEDECGNADTAYVNYSWKVDLTDPVLANLPTGGDLGCNPTAPTCDDNVTANDNCDGDISADVVCTPMAITGDDCNKAQTFMYTVEDECGNADTAYVNYSWKVDLTDPVLANLPTGGDLGCNPTAPSCDDSVTASDNCDGDISADVVCTPMAITGDDCNKAQTFMYTVEDECGNADTAYVNYTWKVDLTDPVLANLPTGGDLGCNPTAPSCDDSVTASDNCDGDISADVVCTPMAITGDDCNKAQTFMYTVEDECGNADTAYVNYTWKVDLTDPVLANLPTGGDLGCNPTAPSCDDSVTASDNCDGDISADVVCTPMAITGDDCNKAQTFMYTVEDECGNADTAYVNYTWKVDLTDPVLANLPTGGDLGCNPTAPSCDDSVTASDNCDGDISADVVCTPMAITGDDCNKAQTFMYTVEDECGNADTAYVNYSWKVDLTDPVLANLPTGGDLGCNPTAPTCDDNVTASDNCDGDISADVVCTPMAITGDDCNKAQTFMYTVEDECGNADTAYVNYSWKVDLTDPVLANLPTGGDLGCNPTAPSCDDSVTASDNCDGDISADVVCTPMAITGDDCNKAQTFMYTVEDECGNADTAYVNYTWKVDLTDPVLANLPTGGDLGCNPTAPSCDDSVTASDNCDGDISADVVCTPMAITGDDCNKAQTFMYTVEDECGNADTAYVNYTWKVDLTDPVLANLPTGGDLGCNPTAPSCDDSVTASDNCDGDISADVVCTPMAITGDDCNKAQTFMYTVEDECGNADTAYVNYTWKVDLTDPVLANLPTGGDLGCNPTAPSCDDSVTASDNCDGDISADVVCTPMAITGDDCNKAQTFMYTVEDECGNADTAYVNYTWKVDLTDPVLANLPTGGDLGCNPTAPSCDDSVTASDNCDGDISADVVCTPMAITGDDCNKAQTFMYTVEDECGNADTAYVNYTWKVDLTDPVLANLPTGGDLGCNPTALSCDDSVTASDNCDGDISADVVCTPMAITGDDCNKAQTFMYTVEDECGNADTAYVNYTWKVDLTEPVLANLPTGGDLGCNPTAPSCDDSVTASDNCDGDISADVVCTPMAITGDDCNKAQTVMYTVEDECGNADTAYVNYSWKVDLTDPVLANLPTGGDLGCNPTAPTCDDNVTANDNCDGDISADVVCTPMVITGDDCNKAQTFMYTVEDECGNADTAYVSYTWKEDSEAPVVDSIPFMDSICNMEPEAMIWAYWTDNCDGSDSTSATPVWGEGTCPEVYGYTFHIEDECGNPTDTTVYVKKWMEQTGNCETVFGRLPEDADSEVVCFLDEGLFDRWGWTNQITMQDTTYVMDLYAGAAHCDTENRTPVGTVEVRWEGDSVVVDYMMNAGNYLEEVHVYVGYEKYPVMGNGKKQKQTVAPGQYTVVVEDEGYYTGAHVVISNVVDPFWIIAHGVACELTCVCYGEVDVNPDGVFILNGSNSIVDANDYPWWEEMDAEDLPPFNGSKRADASLERKKGQKSGNLLLDIEPTLQESELNVFPNPFDEVVNFEFVPAVSGHAVLEIHNMLGQRVARILDQSVEAGELQRVEFRPNSEISGVYLYRLDIDGNTQIGKIIYRNR